MPLHDWTPEQDWVFWHFRLCWLVQLKNALNGGLLPQGYFAMLDVRHPNRNDRPERRITVHTSEARAVIAAVELVSPRDKESELRAGMFAGRIETSLRQGIHVTLIDVLRRGKYDPEGGMHAALWKRLAMDSGTSSSLPDHPLTFASYRAGNPIEAFVDLVDIGQPAPDMPLFLTADSYVPLPLEVNYMMCYTELPDELKAELE